MLPGFSGTLLDVPLADLTGGAAPPAVLGAYDAGGAACDPASFLLPEPLEPTPQPGSVATAALPPQPAVGTQGAGALLSQYQQQYQQPDAASVAAGAASARDLLVKMESEDECLLLPASTGLSGSVELEPDGTGGMMLGGGGGGGGTWRFPSPPAAPPATPPAAAGLLTWHPAALQQAPQALLPVPATAAAAAMSHPATAAQQAPSLFIPVPTAPTAAEPAAAAPSPPSSLPRPSALAPPAPGAATGSSGSEAAPSPAASSSSSAYGSLAAGVPRIASLPNLHLTLGDVSSKSGRSRGARKKAGSGRLVPRCHSHSDLHSDAAGASAGRRAADPISLETAALEDGGDPLALPHQAFLTPAHLRKGKGGRQPAADPRLLAQDPRIDPKKARRIMANRLSAAKSKLKQKAQAERHKAEMMRQGSADGEPEVSPEA